MKAISIKQPWANTIADGIKTIETRTWSTSYRGELLIVSSRKPDIYPAGCAVALVDLVDCVPMTHDHERAACCPIYDGAWAWLLNNIRPVKPVRVRGALSIYNISSHELKMICFDPIFPKSALAQHRAPSLHFPHESPLP